MTDKEYFDSLIADGYKICTMELEEASEFQKIQFNCPPEYYNKKTYFVHLTKPKAIDVFVPIISKETYHYIKATINDQYGHRLTFYCEYFGKNYPKLLVAS